MATYSHLSRIKGQVIWGLIGAPVTRGGASRHELRAGFMPAQQVEAVMVRLPEDGVCTVQTFAASFELAGKIRFGGDPSRVQVDAELGKEAVWKRTTNAGTLVAPAKGKVGVYPRPCNTLVDLWVGGVCIAHLPFGHPVRGWHCFDGQAVEAGCPLVSYDASNPIEVAPLDERGHLIDPATARVVDPEDKTLGFFLECLEEGSSEGDTNWACLPLPTPWVGIRPAEAAALARRLAERPEAIGGLLYSLTRVAGSNPDLLMVDPDSIVTDGAGWNVVIKGGEVERFLPPQGVLDEGILDGGNLVWAPGASGRVDNLPDWIALAAKSREAAMRAVEAALVHVSVPGPRGECLIPARVIPRQVDFATPGPRYLQVHQVDSGIQILPGTPIGVPTMGTPDGLILDGKPVRKAQPAQYGESRQPAQAGARRQRRRK